MIDQATYGIQPTDIIYGVAAKQYDIMLGKCDDSFIGMFLKSIGSTFMNRSMQVICNQNGGLAKVSKSTDFHTSETEILGPFMEKLWALNKCHDIGKRMLNLFL